MRLFENEVGHPVNPEIADGFTEQQHEKHARHHYSESDRYEEMEKLAKNAGHHNLAKLYHHLSKKHKDAGLHHERAQWSYFNPPWGLKRNVDTYTAYAKSSDTKRREIKILHMINKSHLARLHNTIKEKAVNSLNNDNAMWSKRMDFRNQHQRKGWNANI